MKTIGDHIRKKRIELRLTQKELAQKIGTSEVTIYNWENNYAKLSIKWWPKIIDFLGYAPYSPPQSLGDRLAAYRRFQGLTQKEVARKMGVNKTTIRDWENREHIPKEKFFKIIQRFFKNTL
ncbi:MAG: helix-turn-helix transcriptional regulator [bacterium]